jgi:hypothetical protein
MVPVDLLNSFQVMSDLEKSSFKKFLFNMALSSKESELSRLGYQNKYNVMF